MEKSTYSPFEYHKRETISVKNIGGNNFPVVISDLSCREKVTTNGLKNVGYSYDIKTKSWKRSELAADYIFIWNSKFDFEITDDIKLIVNSHIWEKRYINKPNVYPFFHSRDYLLAKTIHPELNFVYVTIDTLYYIKLFSQFSKTVFIFNFDDNKNIEELRTFFHTLNKYNLKTPVILNKNYQENDVESFMLQSSGDFGSLLVDGFGDGIWAWNNKLNAKIIKNTSFGILQACRVRTSKTEYISCPTCGRTLFDIQKTVAEIKKRTKHLKGIKIAIMGCIVNGLGEMADADYGYVGGAKGKVNLYMNKELMKQNISEENAVDELLKLIKDKK